AATSLLFAGSFVAGKYTNFDLGPLSTSLLRYIIAVLALSVLIFHYGTKSLIIQKKDIWQMALLGLTGVVGYHYFFFSSLLYTKAANSAIINATNPLFTSTMAAVFLRERLSGKAYFGVGLALFGVLILLTRGNIDFLLSMQFNLGELLMLLAVFCWVIYSLMIKNLLKKYSGFTITYYASLFGTILLFSLVPLENFYSAKIVLSTASILSLLYMGVFASGIGYYLFNLSLDKIGPTKTASSVYSLVPIFVSVLALLFFDETVTLIMLFCTVLIIIGLNMALKQK
ncbi:MAG: DMT family transporter, partial [candidate division Zixibacteria bacterium]|nr:DMT family transporter [candidate division Zixibacteria bacterium]